MKIWNKAVVGAGLPMLLATAASAQSFNLVMTAAENPGATNSSLADTTVETFNSLSVGDHTNYSSTIGQYNLLSVLGANQYGGAADSQNPNGSHYAVTSESSSLGRIPVTTLTFNSDIAYFGLWWSAGDPQNVLTFFNGTTQVAQFTTATLVNLLPSTYKANPTPGTYHGTDGGEKFAFLNFYGVDGTTFTSVKFSNLGSSGFENDNNTVRQAAFGADPNDTGTTLPGIPVEEVLSTNGVQSIITNPNNFQANVDVSLSPAPEPGVSALLALGGLGGAWMLRRRAVKA